MWGYFIRRWVLYIHTIEQFIYNDNAEIVKCNSKLSNKNVKDDDSINVSNHLLTQSHPVCIVTSARR